MDKHPGSNTINPASYHGNPAARCSDRGVGGSCPHSLGSEAGTAGSRGGVSGDSASTPHQTHKRRLEGVLNKYTNLLQGWQNRYFVLDPDMGQLQYFVNEHSKNQKPRGSLPLIGASVALSDELPHMFTVHSATGEAYKLRASDAGEQQLWMSQMQLCARRHSDSSAKQAPPTPESIDPSEEMTDTEDNEEEDLGVREDQRNMILHLLSQLKLGMDLTRPNVNNKRSCFAYKNNILG
uniref:oxysterol-binding protein-related protein 10-like n=1 Tax=Oncorhynchus gorbuscha TaxID=8017 RepID=UPI001EAF77E6